MPNSADDHRSKAADYRLLAEVAATAEEQARLLLMAQEHLLLAHPDPLLMPRKC